MAIVNFDEVNDAQQSSFKVVKKGAQVLTITNVEDGVSATGTPYVEVTLRSDRDDAEFKPKFFTTAKALPKLMDLIKGVTGTKPVGNFDTDTLPALLIGQSSNFIVDAQIVEKEKDGKVYRNEYPAILRFRDFANKTTPFKDEDARTEDRSTPSTVREAVSNIDAEEKDDLPW